MRADAGIDEYLIVVSQLIRQLKACRVVDDELATALYAKTGS